jgi:hypothetical protein
LKKIILLSALIILLPEKLSFAQEVSIKGGVGFYSIYDENILTGRERKISLEPTPIISFSLSWQLNDLIKLKWENSCRYKKVRADFYGLDTLENKLSIYAYTNYVFYNVDTKAVGQIKLIDLDGIKLSTNISAGISINISNEMNIDFDKANSTILLINPDGEMAPELTYINNTGMIFDAGLEIQYYKFLISASIGI